MDKQKIFATKISNGNEVARVEIGVAILDEGRVSARKYNELKRAANKAITNVGKGQYIRIVTADGRRDTFGGYPAETFVRFEA